MRVTLRDIAERCGVSKSLVSRIINSDPSLRVSARTRARVLEEVNQSGYIQNMNAVALAHQLHKKEEIRPRIGYLSYSTSLHSGIGHPYFSSIVRGIEEQANRQGCELALTMTVHDFRHNLAELEQRFSGENRLDGILLMGAIDDSRTLRSIKRVAKYIVSVESQFEKSVDYVGVDIHQSMRLVLDHMLSLGYEQFGLVCSDAVVKAPLYAYCVQVLREHGLRFAPEWVLDGGYSVEQADQEVTRQLERSMPPRAIVCWNDEMAIGCIKALQNRGYRVPEDVAVTGHDDIAIAAYVDVPLTTVHIYKEDIGRLAVKILADRIETRRKNSVLLEIPGKLVKRDSCGCRLVSREP